MVQKIQEFINTKKGKVIVGCVVAIMVIVVTVSTYLITDGHHRNSNKEADTEVMAQVEETTVEETLESTEVTSETITEEPTTEEVTTEEVETIPVIIPIEDLEIFDDEEIGEDAVVDRNENVIEEETDEPTTEELETEEVIVKNPAFNMTYTAPMQATNEYTCITKGIDVSKHQGDIDWAKVKQAGYTFAIIRCGYRGYESGALVRDSKFEKNIQEATAQGIQVGVYFFSQAMNVREAQEEASLILSMIEEYDITYPVVLDWETQPGYRTYNTVSNFALTSVVKTYVSMVENAGYTAMIYGNKTDLERFDCYNLAKQYKIWYARYPKKYQETTDYYEQGQETPQLDISYQMWQYKSTGTVPGISGDVDMNVAFFTYEGSGVAKYERIKVPNTEIVIRAGDVVDLFEGVTATTASGLDVTKYITYEIYNELGEVVTEDIAFVTEGVYEVTYYINDFTGVPERTVVKLMVGGRPTIKLKVDTLAYFVATDALDVYANDLARAVEQSIQNVLADNLMSANDLEGNDLLSAVQLNAPQNMYIVDGVLVNGLYVFTYQVTDSTGLLGEATLSIEIMDLSNTSLTLSLNELIIKEDSTEETSSKEELTEYESLEEISSEELPTVVVYDTELLNAVLSGNLNNSAGISYELDEALNNDLVNGTIEIGNEYNIKYIMEGLDSAKYYRNCKLVIIE